MYAIRSYYGKWLTGRKYPGNIIIKNKYHQQQQHEHSGLLCNLADSCIYRPLYHKFDEKEKQMSAVQYRDGQKVQDRQIDTEKRNEKDQTRITSYNVCYTKLLRCC